MILNEKPANYVPLFDSVGCLCKYKDMFIILKRTNKRSYPSHWGIPSGKITNSETNVQAIIREMYEETSILLSVENLKFVNTFYVSNNEMSYTYSLFITEFLIMPEVLINSKEHEEYRWVCIEDLNKFKLIPYVIETVKSALSFQPKQIEYQLNLFTNQPELIKSDQDLLLSKYFSNIMSIDDVKKNLNNSKKWYVSLGPPGSGKTTILKSMHKNNPNLNYVCENNILKKSSNFYFYLKKTFIEKEFQYFFNFQLEVLQLRFWLSFAAQSNSLVDETIFSALAYSKALYSNKWLDKYQYESFLLNYNSYNSFLPPPTKILYFFCDTNSLIKRIKKRGRMHESYYTHSYVDKLNIAFYEVAIYLKSKNYNVEFINTSKKSIDEILKQYELL